jgi:hypothetical protein
MASYFCAKMRAAMDDLVSLTVPILLPVQTPVMTTPLINQLGIVKRNIERADSTAVEQLGRLGSATVHEAMGRVGLMKRSRRRISRRWR